MPAKGPRNSITIPGKMKQDLQQLVLYTDLSENEIIRQALSKFLKEELSYYQDKEIKEAAIQIRRQA
jgi:predicted transcriptional regulator